MAKTNQVLKDRPYNGTRRAAAQPKDPIKQAAAFESHAVQAAQRTGASVEETRRQFMERQQAARVAAQERNDLQVSAQTEAIHRVILESPKAVSVLAELMNDKKVPAGVRRLCANDIATLACIQKVVEKRLESAVKDVSEMDVNDLNSLIGSMTKTRDALYEAMADGEIVAVDPS